jgi:hypothetical protein
MEESTLLTKDGKFSAPSYKVKIMDITGAVDANAADLIRDC